MDFFVLAKLSVGQAAAPGSATLTGRTPNAVRLRASNPWIARPKPALPRSGAARGVQSTARAEKTPKDVNILKEEQYKSSQTTSDYFGAVLIQSAYS